MGSWEWWRDFYASRPTNIRSEPIWTHKERPMNATRTKYVTVQFASLGVGEKFYLTNSKCDELYGPYTKVEARQCEQSAKFYASHNSPFFGWNATRPDWNGDKWVDGEWGLKPDTQCVPGSKPTVP